MPDDTFRWVVTGAVAISTLCILILAIAGIAMYRIISRLEGRVTGVVNRVEPLIDTVRKIASDNVQHVNIVAARAAEIAANAKEISDVAKDQAHRFAELGRDFADRAKAQVARVDAAVDQTVDHVQMAGEHVKSAVMKPVREAGGVLAGLKAAVSTYAAGARGPALDHLTQDEEMFI
jgi:hypothetical protein